MSVSMMGFFIGAFFWAPLGFIYCAMLTLGKISDLKTEIARLRSEKKQ